LSEATREALEKAVRESVETKLIELDRLRTRAVETAREASDRLTAQMLSIGQSAVALEAHIERSREAQLKDSGEEFARVFAADGFDAFGRNRRAEDPQRRNRRQGWNHYLKGNPRRVHAPCRCGCSADESRRSSRNMKAIRSSRARSITMSRTSRRCCARSGAERDGGMIAVTLMSSDMGKLYAALAQAVEKR
jgi:hypothetical protein